MTTTAQVPNLPSLSIRQIAEMWGCDEQDVVECIVTGVLPAYVLLHKTAVKIGGDFLEDEEPRTAVLDGHYLLPIPSAVILIENRPPAQAGSPRVIVEVERGVFATLTSRSYRLPDRESVRVLTEDLQRYDRWRQAAGVASGDDGREERSMDRASNRHRERCRAIAVLLWEKEPDLRIDHMLLRDEIARIALEGVTYSIDVKRGWIRDLNPDPKVGRPKKLR